MTAVNKNKVIPAGSSGGGGGGKGVRADILNPVASPAMKAAPTLATSDIERAAGPKAAELRAWQLAMLELAGRHSVPQVGMGR